MGKLMEKKKEQTRKKILKSAIRLFEESGYQKTTIEQIAAEAQVGVGTLYNYFSSKVELLFSIIETDTYKYVEDLNKAIANSKGVKESIYEFYEIYLNSFSNYGKKVWSEVFGEAFLRQLNLAKMINTIDKHFIDKLKELLFFFQKSSMIKENIDVINVTSVLYSLLGYNIILYISDNEISQMMLRESLKSQIDVVINSLII
ncbi:UNVERIFIED_CONTAM: TetR family transcriptional regulator [Acetivibrio alkalicellulosi]